MNGYEHTCTKFDYEEIDKRMRAVDAYTTDSIRQGMLELGVICKAVGGCSETAVRVVNGPSSEYPEWWNEDIESMALSIQGCMGLLEHIERWDESMYW